MLLAKTDLSSEEVECRLNEWSLEFAAAMWQGMWDEMFMVDAYPENRARFGLEMIEVIRQVAGASD